MRSRGERRRGRGGGGFRPVLLAAGLGLMWFAEFQSVALPAGVPNWALALVLGCRLLADIVAAMVIVSVLRLVLMMLWLVVTRWRLQRRLEVQ